MENSQNSQDASRMETTDTQTGRGKNKRFWSPEEIQTLIGGLLELSTDPKYKGDGNFKPGFLKKLESMLLEKFPNCGLKAYPHIDSKTKWLREKYNAITDMLALSGFNWDYGSKTLQCNRQAYEEHVKRNKKASGLWGVQFPYLDDLDKIYGTNRATGTAVENFEDAVNHLEGEPVNLDMDDDDEEDDESIQSTQPSPRIAKKARKEPSSKGKGKKRVAEDNESADLRRYMGKMDEHLATIANAYTVAQKHEEVVMNREQELDDQKKRLFSEMLKIPGLTTDESLRAVNKIGSDTSLLPFFYQCPEDLRQRYVLSIINAP